VELERRGVVPFLIVTRTFLPLVQAQAKARRVEPKVVVVNHPIGGLNSEELAERVDTAFAEMVRLLDELEVW
jgi:hypothetical protein